MSIYKPHGRRYEDLKRVINTDGDMLSVLRRLAVRYRVKAAKVAAMAENSEHRERVERAARYYREAEANVTRYTIEPEPEPEA